jgi:hypothetical protein
LGLVVVIAELKLTVERLDVSTCMALAREAPDHEQIVLCSFPGHAQKLIHIPPKSSAFRHSGSHRPRLFGLRPTGPELLLPIVTIDEDNELSED